MSLSSTGTLTLTGSIPTKSTDFPSGLATDKNGYIYVANNDPDTFAVSSSVAIYNASGTEVGRCAFSGSYYPPNGTPNFPLAIATLSDGSKTYVASQRDGAIYVLDTSVPASPKLLTTISTTTTPTLPTSQPCPQVTGSHPTGLLLNQAQSLLYVANAHCDTVSTISTNIDAVVSTTLFRFRRLTSFFGATPIALGLSPERSTLYAAMGDLNAVAVADVKGNSLAVKGFIPVGWYPTGVVVSPDGKRLLVTNAKGVQALHPNPGYVQWQFNDNPYHNLNLIVGTVEAIPVPSASQLATYTSQVLANNGFNQVNIQIDHRLDPIGLAAGGITHVIYIVKENRTYDQVLGDLPQGNGDPSLVLFGNNVTPSQHALAQRFVLLDNFYDTGEASGDGWPWSTGSMANEYVIKNLPYNYSNRGRNYNFEGQDNGYPAGGFPATDPYGNTLSPTFPGGLPPISDVAEAPGRTHLGRSAEGRTDLPQLRLLLHLRSDGRHPRQLSRGGWIASGGGGPGWGKQLQLPPLRCHLCRQRRADGLWLFLQHRYLWTLQHAQPLFRMEAGVRPDAGERPDRQLGSGANDGPLDARSHAGPLDG